eukprot:487354-Rhodomonas_salina.2
MSGTDLALLLLGTDRGTSRPTGATRNRLLAGTKGQGRWYGTILDAWQNTTTVTTPVTVTVTVTEGDRDRDHSCNHGRDHVRDLSVTAAVTVTVTVTVTMAVTWQYRRWAKRRGRAFRWSAAYCTARYPATRSPVLTSTCYAKPGTDAAYGATRCPAGVGMSSG